MIQPTQQSFGALNNATIQEAYMRESIRMSQDLKEGEIRNSSVEKESDRP
jgi:hypothetical protein